MGTCICSDRAVMPWTWLIEAEGPRLVLKEAEDQGSTAPWVGMRVLVTGATGLLGRQVYRVFTEKGWQVHGLAFRRAAGCITRCDLTDSEDLRKQFEQIRPSIVIHCAAERRPDVLEADKALAHTLNADVPRAVGELCSQYGAWLVYLSTNYVFDGTCAPYAEDAKPRPPNVYGESKLAGEQAVEAAHPNTAIVRVPLLYGPIEHIGETSVDALLMAIRGAKSPRLDNWQERYPTSTEDVAAVLEAMAETYVVRQNLQLPVPVDASPVDLEPWRGVFHWQANERHTKYTMAVIIAEIANLDAAHFVQVDTAPPAGSAPRPQFERMLCTRLEKLLGISGTSHYRSSFKEGMQRHLAPFL